jgi:drug/metabolite transporter (DMT)-like permease
VPFRAYAVLFIGITSVALAAVLVKMALLENVPALVVADTRLILAALILTPMTLRRHSAVLRGLDRRSILLIVTAGVFLAVHFASWVSSLQYTSVLISVVMVTTSPVWVGLLEVFVLKTRLNWAVVAGIVVTIIGSILLAIPQPESDQAAVTLGNSELIGGGLALLGAITFSVYMIIGSKMRERLPLLAYLWGVYGTAAIVLLIFVALSGASFTGHSPTGYLLLLLITIFPQLIGHSSLNYALAYLSATYISVATQLEPIGSAIVAYFVLSETPTALQIFGSAIILAGVLVATLNPVKRFREARHRAALAADSV